MKKLTIILLVFLLFPYIAVAQEDNFTVLITEINFKNKNQDYIKFKILSTAKQINIKGLTFYDDKNFKTIDQNFIAKNNQEFTLTFNSAQKDLGSQLFTDHNGLTATTEQIILSKNKQILDLACWYQNPISAAEQKDFSKIQDQIPLTEIQQNCFSSQDISTNQSVFRVTSEINSNSWKTNSPPPTALKSTSSGLKSSSSISLPQDSTPLDSENQNTLIINEFMPNPAGTDTNNEWIEILNNSDSTINPNGYIIDDEDQGSKPYLISKAAPLNPGQVLLFPSKITKIALGNTKDQVRLFSPNKKLIDQIEYQDSRENLSYARINIDGKSDWQWTDFPSPGQPNPNLISITAEITAAPQFESIYYFTIKDSENKKYLVTFTENLIKAPLAESIFTAGSLGTFTGILQNENQLQLSNYEISEPADTANNSQFPWIAVTLLAIGVIYFFYKKQKWKTSIILPPS